jgi:hypothetical protein
MRMQPVCFKRHGFPPDVVRLAVWLYFRFTLSFRDVEEMLAHRGIEVSYETIRCWILKFGRALAQNLRRSRPKPTGRWHLDEMAVKIRGKHMWLWRAVDDEGEVLDTLIQKPQHRRRLATAAQRRVPGAARWRSTPTGTHAREQSSGELASGHPTPRAQTTAVQVATFSAKVACDSRRRLQQLQLSKTPGPPIDPAPLGRRSRSHLGSDDRGRLSDRPLPTRCASGNST